MCMACGHCVAVCPHGAFSHSVVPIQDSPQIKKERIIDKQQAVQFLRSRLSIRVYQDKPVEKEKIQWLIENARYAPTGGNTQMVEWLVITDKKQIKELAGHTVDWMNHVLKVAPDSAPYFVRLFAQARLFLSVNYYVAVCGPKVFATSDTKSAGNPPSSACL